MGKKQHSKDRLFITRTEHKYLYGGKVEAKETKQARLPFDCCALTLAPFKDPVCTPEGHVFDLVNIVPYVRKHKSNPITGEPLSPKDLIHLNFHKNTAGKYFCPITYKEFSDHSHIVAIRTSGNVFMYSVVQELNIKHKNYSDLLTGEKFTKKDLIVIQDPQNPRTREISNFEFIRRAREKEEAEKEGEGVRRTIRADAATERILNEMEQAKMKKRKKDEDSIKGVGEEDEKEKAIRSMFHSSSAAERQSVSQNGKKIKYSQFTTARVTSSFTSTAYQPSTKNVLAEASEEELLEERWKAVKAMKKKGYARIHTNCGDINIELHCDIVPRTCDNFLGLCDKNFYDGVKFHRVIPGFMMQGGDPTGTGRGGESKWGSKPFKDELTSQLLHKEAGTLSMANSGPNTNKSQFFITFKGCRHLDYKHSVFGRVVGGMDVIRKIESIPTNSKDEPESDVIIRTVTVFVDPFKELEEQEEAKDRLAKDNELNDHQKAGERDRVVKTGDDWEVRREWYSNPAPKPQGNQGTGVGKYLKKTVTNPMDDGLGHGTKQVATKAPVQGNSAASKETYSAAQYSKKAKPKKTGFSDFSAW